MDAIVIAVLYFLFSLRGSFGLPALVSKHYAKSMKHACINGEWDELGLCHCKHGYTGETCEIKLFAEFDVEPAMIENALPQVEHELFELLGYENKLNDDGRKTQAFDGRTVAYESTKSNSHQYIDAEFETKFHKLEVNGKSADKISNSPMQEQKRHENGGKSSPAEVEAVEQDTEDTDYVVNENVTAESLNWGSYEDISTTLQTGSIQKQIDPQILNLTGNFRVIIENDVDCVHGVQERVFQQCICDDGYIGEDCQSNVGQLPSSYRGLGDKCLHGIPVYTKSCLCIYGYTGKTCETEINPIEQSSGFGTSGDDSEEDNMISGETSGFKTNSIETETPVHDDALKDQHPSGDFSGSGSGITSTDFESSSNDVFGSGYGVGSGSGNSREASSSLENIWHENLLDQLEWKYWWNILVSNKDVATKQHILENDFIAVSTGILGITSRIDYLSHFDESDNMYRFSFLPKIQGGKSRLELSTCFTTPEHAMKLFGTTTLNPSIVSSLGTYCPIVHEPIDAIHTHSYEMYFPERDFPRKGKYILTQWHGSADPTIVRDEFGCVARLSHSDNSKLCKKHVCKEGSIFDQDGQFIGLRYVQGGYPPLTLSIDGGEFLVSARSDDRVFPEKGGCGWKKHKTPNFRCPLHPHQQFQLLARIPFKDMKFDSWVRFVWKIKWSEFGATERKRSGEDPGVMLSKAWIRLSINNVSVIDWTGPCGRNDHGRVPYFKIGIYNPSGSEYPLRMYVRNYQHYFTKTQDLSMGERETVEKLSVVAKRHETKVFSLNRNTIVENMRFRHVTGDARCELRAEINHVSHLMRTRFSRLQVDKKTLELLQTMAYAIEAQDFRIRQLETRLEEMACHQRRDDDDGPLEEEEEEDSTSINEVENVQDWASGSSSGED